MSAIAVERWEVSMRIIALVAATLALAGCLESTEGTVAGETDLPLAPCGAGEHVPELRELAGDVASFTVTDCGDVAYYDADTVHFHDATLALLREDPLSGGWFTSIQAVGGRGVMWSTGESDLGFGTASFVDLGGPEREALSAPHGSYGPVWRRLDVNGRVGLVTGTGQGVELYRVDLDARSVVKLAGGIDGSSLVVASDRALWVDDAGGVWWADAHSEPSHLRDIWSEPVRSDTVETREWAVLSPDGQHAVIARSMQRLDCGAPDCEPMSYESDLIEVASGDVVATAVPGEGRSAQFVGAGGSLPAVLPTYPGYSAVHTDGSVTSVAAGDPSGALSDGRILLTLKSPSGGTDIAAAPLGDDPMAAPRVVEGMGGSMRVGTSDRQVVTISYVVDAPTCFAFSEDPACDSATWRVVQLRAGEPEARVLVETIGPALIAGTATGETVVVGRVNPATSSNAVRIGTSHSVLLFSKAGEPVWSGGLFATASPTVRPAGPDHVLITLQPPFGSGRSELWIVRTSNGAAEQVAARPNTLTAMIDPTGTVLAWWDPTTGELFAGAMPRP